jgi:diguanylate cyclase (GGDEF)-like protein
MLFIDIFSRFDGKPDSIYPVINQIANFMIFLLSPVMPSIWLLFACYNLFGEEDKIKRLLYPLLVIIAGHTVILLLSQTFGWLYYIDSYNIYHRGPFFLLSPFVSLAMLLATSVIIVVNRGKVGKRQYFSLLFFAVPPFLCIILQIAFYGVSIILSSVVLSLLIVFFNIQTHSMYIDYLTEVSNRKKLEICLKKKVSLCTENKTFSAIMIDLNDFKSINDTYGHKIGDEALQISAKLLKSCLRPNDFISRFGGDEFCIVLDSSNITILEMIIAELIAVLKIIISQVTSLINSN